MGLNSLMKGVISGINYFFISSCIKNVSTHQLVPIYAEKTTILSFFPVFMV